LSLLRSNNSMQRTALRAAADAERSASRTLERFPSEGNHARPGATCKEMRWRRVLKTGGERDCSPHGRPVGGRTPIYQNFNKALKSSVISNVQPHRVFRRTSLIMDCSTQVLWFHVGTVWSNSQARGRQLFSTKP